MGNESKKKVIKNKTEEINGLKVEQVESEAFENSEYEFQLYRVRQMKKTLIVLVIAMALFLLALKYHNEYKIVGYLGIIPGVTVGFMTAKFFSLLFKRNK